MNLQVGDYTLVFDCYAWEQNFDIDDNKCYMREAKIVKIYKNSDRKVFLMDVIFLYNHRLSGGHFINDRHIKLIGVN